MQISPKQQIADLPAVVLRNTLRHLRDGTWGSESLEFYLKVPSVKAKQLLAKLARLGYVERDKSSSEPDAWSLTDAGRTLTNANALRSLPRGKATQILEKFLGRVEQVNADPYYLYRVSKVVLFGSYLSEKEALGDIDLAIELSPKEPDKERFGQLITNRSREAAENGRRFSTFVDELTWPDTEVRRFLKGKSRYISLHSTGDGVLKTCAQRVLFP